MSKQPKKINKLRFVAFVLAVILVVGGVSWAIDNLATLFGVQIGFFGRSDPFMRRGSINVLIAGVDQFNLADLIIVAQYNFETGEVNAIQIPRDTRVETSRWDKKINSAMSLGGIDELKYDVLQVTGLEIDRYVIVGFQGFRDIIDALGGVEIDVPIRMFYTDPYQSLTIDLQRGVQMLNGRQAEGFVRFRKNNDGSGYPDGDLGRIRAQEQFIAAMLDRLVSLQGVLRLPQIAGIVQESVRTSLTGDEMIRYLTIAIGGDFGDVNIIQLPGGTGYVGGVSYFLQDTAETQRLIDEYFTPQPVGRIIRRTSNEPTIRINRNINRTIRVEIVDATGVSIDGAGVGEMAEALLASNAFNVATVRTAESQEQTFLIDHNNRSASREILKVLPYVEVAFINDIDSFGNYDVTLILGINFNEYVMF